MWERGQKERHISVIWVSLTFLKWFGCWEGRTKAKVETAVVTSNKSRTGNGVAFADS